MGKKAAERLTGRKVNMGSEIGARITCDSGLSVVVQYHPYNLIKAGEEKGGKSERLLNTWCRTWEFAGRVASSDLQEPPEVIEVATVKALRGMLRRVSRVKRFGYDYETWGDVTALRPELCNQFSMLSVGVAFDDPEFGEVAFSFTLDHPGRRSDPKMKEEWFKFLLGLNESGPTPVCHNAKYEHKVNLRVAGSTVLAHDSMLVSFATDEAFRHDLASCMRRCGIYWEHKSGNIGKDPLSAPIDELLKYNGLDALAGLKCYEKMVGELKGRVLDDLSLKEEFAMELAEFEGAGIHYDKSVKERVRAELASSCEKMREEVWSAKEIVAVSRKRGVEFNPNSPAQMKALVLGELKAKVRTKTKKGGISLNKSVLEKLTPQYPILGKLAEYKSMSAMISGFLDKWEEFVSPAGLLHGMFSMGVVLTSRLSSTDPNLQNIPNRSIVKSIFTSRYPGGCIVGGDYKQQEPRLVAGFSQDPKMKKALNGGFDLHSFVAAQIYGMEYEDVKKDSREREIGKRMNLGIIYGQTEYGLAAKTGMSLPEAKDVLNRYDQEFPYVNRWKDEMVRFALRHGYVEDLFGGRRHLHDIRSNDEYVRNDAIRRAGNSPIQMTASTMTMIALGLCQRMVKGLGIAFLQVHDAIYVDSKKGKEEKVMKLMEEAMLIHNDQPYWADRGVPFGVDFKVGPNMYEMEAVS